MTFPVRRMRRLREKASTRDLVRETTLKAADFIYPVFVREKLEGREEIPSMPGIFRHGVASAVEECARAEKAGIRGVILFGIPEKKDEKGSGAWVEDGIIQKAVRAIKDRGLGIYVICDVCMCEYTSHGHCGWVCEDGTIDNDKSLELLVKTALSQVRAGADMVAPSDMMDGRVAAIRRGLDGEGRTGVPIMSYAAKYASAFYGPFRDAAGSAPAFGDRRSHQMDPANVREALMEVELDIEEGADIVMVKPALAYLDVICKVRERFNVPVAAYNVSGEFSMIEAAAAKGWVDRERIITEVLCSIKRAGADIILTYHAVEVAERLSR
jgi:porphobilinogen synthase